MIVLDHCSTDETPAILADIQRETGRLTVLREDSPVWNEMGHRQRLLDAARAEGATHIAIIDADEVISGNYLDSVRDQAIQAPPGAYISIPMRNLYGGIGTYRVNDGTLQGGIWGNSITTVAFGNSPACEWVSDDGYQHHQREPRNSRLGLRIYPTQMEGGVMHLQFANRRRLLAKHALYQMDEVIRWPGRRPVYKTAQEYGMAPNWHGATFADVPASWWEPYSDIMHHLRLDDEPWQIRECIRLMEVHGPEKFAGLNLFGVVGEPAYA